MGMEKLIIRSVVDHFGCDARWQVHHPDGTITEETTAEAMARFEATVRKRIVEVIPLDNGTVLYLLPPPLQPAKRALICIVEE